MTEWPWYWRWLRFVALTALTAVTFVLVLTLMGAHPLTGSASPPGAPSLSACHEHVSTPGHLHCPSPKP